MSKCGLCGTEITDKDIETGNFNESLDVIVHQSCFEYEPDECPEGDV